MHPAWKEGGVQLPRANGFCYRASEFSSKVGQWASDVFMGNSNH